jgi:hypothetical protein
MDKTKRSYFLPSKLVTTFDKECKKGGYVRERVVAAAVNNFLNASPNDRHKMFLQLDSFLTKRGK